jgi:diguanylate cyclase (GGDEF)-like protein/PAS domain S-box-containing protein
VGGDDRSTRAALRLAGIYLVVASVWILLSDLAFELIGAPVDSAWANIVKGLLFVSLTAAMLHRLVLGLLGRQDQLHHELARHAELQAALFNLSPESMWVYDPDSLRILEVNDAMVRRAGRSREELLQMHTTDLGPSGGERIVQRVPSGAYDAEPTLWLHFGPHGEHRWVEVVTHPVEWDGSFAMLALSRDVTGQKRAEEALRSSERRLAGVLASMQEMAFSVELASGRIHYLNDAAAQVMGRDPSDLIIELGDFEAIVHPDDLDEYRQAMREAVTTGWTDREFRTVDADGSPRTLHVRARGVLGPSGRVEQVDGVAIDMTHRQALVDLVEHQRSFDQLTGLPNRLSLVAAMDASLAGGAVESGPDGAFVALFDLDRFATINQSAGHHAGDAVLLAVAERVTAVLRPGMVASRVGGDEFAVFCPAGVASADEVIDELRDAVEEVFTIGEYEFFVTMSVGLAEAIDGHDAEDMLRDAHVAMTQAKDRTAGVEYFHPAYRSLITDQVRIEGELRRALIDDELVLVYQPQVSLRTDRIVAVEALVRWQHPTRGIVGAADFVPAAERSGVILDIGRRVLDLACIQAVEWRGRYGDAAPRIWVNLSRRELDAPGLSTRFLATLIAHDLDRSAIGVEVTETAFVADAGPVARALRELADAGIGVALDDFGTGWSSLQSLKAFPLEAVKIDRAFTRNVGRSVDDTQITKAVIGMARGMSLLSMAEGVETVEQLGELRRLGCDQVQGYLLGRPSPPVEIENLLDTGGKPTVFLR